MNNESDDKICVICLENCDVKKKVKCNQVICLKCLKNLKIYKIENCPYCNKKIEGSSNDFPTGRKLFKTGITIKCNNCNKEEIDLFDLIYDEENQKINCKNCSGLKDKKKYNVFNVFKNFQNKIKNKKEEIKNNKNIKEFIQDLKNEINEKIFKDIKKIIVFNLKSDKFNYDEIQFKLNKIKDEFNDIKLKLLDYEKEINYEIFKIKPYEISFQNIMNYQKEIDDIKTIIDNIITEIKYDNKNIFPDYKDFKINLKEYILKRKK